MAFKVIMTQNERLAQLILMTSKAARIQKAVKLDKVDILNIDPEGYSYCYYKESCPRVAECREKWKVLDKEKKKAKKNLLL